MGHGRTRPSSDGSGVRLRQAAYVVSEARNALLGDGVFCLCHRHNLLHNPWYRVLPLVRGCSLQILASLCFRETTSWHGSVFHPFGGGAQPTSPITTAS